MVLAVVLSVLIGLSLGLLGGGGSILTVPILVYALGVEPRSAIATSLLVVGITSAVAALARARRGDVKGRVGLVFGLAGMAGAFVGGRLGHHVPAGVLLMGFALMMVATAVAMMRGRRVNNTPTPAGKTALPVARVALQGAGVGLVAGLVGAGGVLLGAGTAMVYPTLLAAIGDVAQPRWRASAVGVYRLWRDLGYAAGALLAGLVADALGLGAAVWAVAAITLASGVVVAVRMRETLPKRGRPRAPGVSRSPAAPPVSYPTG